MGIQCSQFCWYSVRQVWLFGFWDELGFMSINWFSQLRFYFSIGFEIFGFGPEKELRKRGNRVALFCWAVGVLEGTGFITVPSHHGGFIASNFVSGFSVVFEAVDFQWFEVVVEAEFISNCIFPSMLSLSKAGGFLPFSLCWFLNCFLFACIK